MPFLRSLATFLLSFVFTSFIFIAITSYTIGTYVQKESITNFIVSELSTGLINNQCQEQCSQYTDYKDACIQLCISELTNQTQGGIDKSVDEIYQQKFFNVTLDEVSSLLSKYILFTIIGIISGFLLLVVSKTPLLSLGKNFISISISLFISSFTPQFIISSISLPFNLGEAIKNYLFPGFNQQTYFGIAFLIVGIILVVANYFLKRRKKTVEKKK